jgi:hypothetical protein
MMPLYKSYGPYVQPPQQQQFRNQPGRLSMVLEIGARPCIAVLNPQPFTSYQRIDSTNVC